MITEGSDILSALQRIKNILLKEKESRQFHAEIEKLWGSGDVPSRSEIDGLINEIAEVVCKEPQEGSDSAKSLSRNLVHLRNYVDKNAPKFNYRKWFAGFRDILFPWKAGKYVNELPIVERGGWAKLEELESYDAFATFIKGNVSLFESCNNNESRISRVEYKNLDKDVGAECCSTWSELVSVVLFLVSNRIVTPKRNWDRLMYGGLSFFVLIAEILVLILKWGCPAWVGITTSLCSLFLSGFACLQAKYELEGGVCVDSVASSSIYQKIGNVTLTGFPMATILSGDKLFSVSSWVVVLVFIFWFLNIMISLTIESIRVYSNVRLNRG
mgnify:CR=1 FL=1|jgi:hypothetical protein